ncbi:MAG: ribonuclease PH [Candidatus Omnitrophica bacterium]|nr:ribonuclease PH [Candidatus Omnitrophota bacterium]
MRSDGRKNNELRNVKITPHYIKQAKGSCLIEMGDTRVICTASVEDGVPRFLKGKGQGWVTAEYGMLPASCASRVSRESAQGKMSGRTHEVQRLIGRSLRSICDMNALGERTIWIDADVIQADGGTRCAGITGSFIALAIAIDKIMKDELIEGMPLKSHIAAVSVGMVKGMESLDLNYEEDSTAEVDMNVVMTGNGEFVEIQGTAEKEPFSSSTMDKMVSLAKNGIKQLIECQKDALKAQGIFI